MHRPQKDVGSLEGERQHAHDQRQDQQRRIGCIEAENDGSVGDESDGEHRRNRQADARQRGAQREVDGTLKAVRQCGTHRGQGFGRQDEHRHQEASERRRGTQNAP